MLPSARDTNEYPFTPVGLPILSVGFVSFKTSETERSSGDLQIKSLAFVCKPTTPSRGLFGDATLTILSNKNNPLVEVRFRDVYPASLSGLDYNQNNTDVEYLTATCDFKYTLYEIVTL